LSGGEVAEMGTQKSGYWQWGGYPAPGALDQRVLSLGKWPCTFP
jgi:hypothetical protein